MPIRLLAVDLDGTLLTSERVPHPENVLALRRAHEAGILVVPASRRIAASIAQFSKELGLSPAMICSNGSHVQGPDGNELLHIGLSKEAVEITLKYTEAVGVHTSAYTRNDLFFLTDSPWGEVYRQRVRSVMPKSATAGEVRQMNLLKLILIDHPSAIKGHHDALADLLSSRLGALTESEPEYLEVLSPEASKGLGLKVLSESLGIAQSETAAIGDYLNDLEMVQWAGIGAAMANAVPEVKAVAQLKVTTNNNAGVAEFIDYLIERNRRELEPK